MKNTNEKKTNKNEVKKDEEKEATDRAEKAKERALVKIEGNIRKIYGMKKLQKSMEEVRKNFHIYGIRNEDKEEIQSMRSIGKIIKFLKGKWVSRNFKDKKVTKIINTHLAIYNINEELDQLHDKIAAAEAKKSLSEIKIYGERYLNDMVNNFINGYNLIFEKHKVNQKIWKSILGAMLFDIPMETVIRVKTSILPDYMPTINKYLQIQMNELNTLGDLECIKSKIKTAQSTYKKKYKYKNFHRTKKSFYKK